LCWALTDVRATDTLDGWLHLPVLTLDLRGGGAAEACFLFFSTGPNAVVKVVDY